MNSNSHPATTVSKNQNLELKSKKTKNQSKPTSSKVKLSKSSKKKKTRNKSRPKSRTPKKELKKSQNRKIIPEENQELEKRVTVGTMSKSNSKCITINESSEDKAVDNENVQSKKLIITNGEIKDNKNPSEVVENNEFSQVYTQYPTQVIQNDQKTQSIINSQNDKFKQICSTDSKTKISKVPISMEGKKTASKSNGNFEPKEKSISDNDINESNNATKYESNVILSTNNPKIIEEKIYESQKPEKKQENSKNYSSDGKKKQNDKDKFNTKSKSDCKTSKNIIVPVNHEIIQDVFENENHQKRSIVELKNIESVSLLRNSPVKDTDYKSNLKEAKSKKTESEMKSETKQVE